MSETPVKESPQTLNQALSCDYTGVDEEWDIDELNCPGELREAIEAVRENHDASPVVDESNMWLLQPYWNDKTAEVRVALYGLEGTYTHDGGDDAE